MRKKHAGVVSYHIRYFAVASTVLQSFQIDFPEHILSGNECNMGPFNHWGLD